MKKDMIKTIAGIITIILIIIVATSAINNTKSTNSNTIVESKDNISTESENNTTIESYSQIKSEESFKVGTILYTLEDNEYVPSMEILNIDENVELEDGYISKKAMNVKTCDETQEIFWKNIEQTLKTSLSDYGIKYYEKLN